LKKHSEKLDTIKTISILQLMTHYEEHIQDSAFADTWQRAEAEATRKYEAEAAVADREEEHAEWVAAGCPPPKDLDDWQLDLYEDHPEGSPF